MPPFINLAGKRFGRWVVIERAFTVNKQFIKWRCRCDCGTEALVFGGSLRHGKSVSCGCLQVEAITTHGQTGMPEYTIWQMMRQRCNNPKHLSYQSYGERGIKVCERWEDSFESFFADMGKRPTPSHTLDRKDNDGNYSPENCKWSTPLEQGANKRTSQVIEFNGESHTRRQWAIKLGVSVSTLTRRLKAGWSISDAVTQPPSRKRLDLR